MLERDWTTCSTTIIILGSIVSIMGEDLYDHLKSTMIFTLIMEKKWKKISYELRKLRGKWLWPRFGLAHHLVLGNRVFRIPKEGS